jgi:hypothetical protein
MTDDLINNLFSGVDEFYPGSKRKRKEPKQEEEVTFPTWDTNPKVRTLPSGKDIEMFTIGALALALNRPIITIRTWIKEGYLPSAPYRLPAKKDKHGKDHQGKRLYSRAMVEVAVELFTKAGVLTTKRIDWSNYQQLSNEIADAWSKIRADETN